MTILFYIITFILDKFLTAVVAFPVTALMKTMNKSIVFASFIAGLLVFYFYDFLWLELEGGHLPILLLIILILSNLALLQSGKLIPAGAKITVGELISQTIYGLYLLFGVDSIRWV